MSNEIKLPEFLKQDPYMITAEQTRKERLSDPLVPRYHYIVSHEYMNDPNGLCYFNGNWHLFHQLNDSHGNKEWNWAHAISPDLVHWKELPLAIVPDPDGGNELSSWSGAIAIHDNMAVAMYYGYHGAMGLYCQTSTDPLLLQWNRVKTGPCIPCGGVGPEQTRIPYAVYPGVYDPFIWWEDGQYYALSAGVKFLRNGARVREEYLFSSKDLLEWKYLHPLLQNDRFGSVNDDGACPYFCKIGEDMRMLLFFSHGNGPEYMIGYWDKETQKFDVVGGARLNHCSRLYGYAAPTAYADPSGDGSVRAFYNMHATGAVTCMSLPHTITLDEAKSGIAVAPAKELESLRRNERKLSEPLCVPTNKEMVIDIAKGSCVEIDITLSFEPVNMVQLRLLRSEDGKQYTALNVHPGCGTSWRDLDEWHMDCLISMDCTHSSHHTNLSAPETVSFPKKDYAPIRLRIFIDRSAIEVFTMTGLPLGRRVLPDVGSDTFSICSINGDCTITEMTVWDMDDINEHASNLNF